MPVVGLGHLVRSLGFWVAVTVGCVVSLGVFVSVEYWDWLKDGTGQTSNAEAVRNISLTVGGVVAILIALWRSLVAERQSEIGERTYLNERYRQAASMLGDSELPVRVGGIVALERLAADHPAEFRHEAFKLLLEFVRAPPALKQLQPKVWDGWLQLERPATRQDVQAAIRVITELKRPPRIGDGSSLWFWLDLRGAQLCGVDLCGLRLARANLENANLMFAHLERTDLTGAQLQWANCRQALLKDADLSDATMSGADFSGVLASGCKFRGARMPAKMIGAFLDEADLTEAVFPDTDLTGATLRAANLTGADFRGQSYQIDHAGPHEADDDSIRISQEQLDESVADADRPPALSVRSVADGEPPKRLVWRGKVPS